MGIYVVKSGDSVDSIALEQNELVNDLIFDNQLVYPYSLAVGQALYVREQKEDCLSFLMVLQVRVF